MLKSNWIISPEIGMKILKKNEVSPPSMTTKKKVSTPGVHPFAKGSMDFFSEIYGLRLATFSRVGSLQVV